MRRAYSFHTPAGDAESTREAGFYIKRLPGGAFSEWLFESDRTGVRFEVHGLDPQMSSRWTRWPPAPCG